MTATIIDFAGARSPDEKPRAMAKKMLWLKFYPGDWRSDPAVRQVSLAARGLWIDMLMIMHESVPRGSLVMGGRAIDSKTLARMVGADSGEVAALLDELEAAAVFSRKKNGTIYSRRMEIDDYRRARAAADGKKGGNPALKPESDATRNRDTNQSHSDPLPENRPRIEEESRKIEYKVSDCKETENSGGVKDTHKPKRLETREDKKEETPIVPLNSASDDKAVQACVTAWNNLAGEAGLAKVQHVTGARRSKILARLKDVGGLPGWFATCDKVRQSAFLRGKNSDWRVTFDWLLSPTNIAKTLEGNYDDRKSTRDDRRQSVADAMADERRRILESAGDPEFEGGRHDDDSASPTRGPRRSD